jgi:type II secretory pathway pseudopilin PulG
VAHLPKSVTDRPDTGEAGWGYQMMNRAKRQGLRSQGGFTLIDMLFVVGLIGLLCSLALPALGRAKGAAQSSSALGTLRVVNSAELSFAITCGLGFYAPDLPTLGVPPPGSTEGFLSVDLTSATSVIKSGYTFTVVATPLGGAPGSCNGLGPGESAPGYAVTGDPLNPAENPRFFGTNADGVIYEDTASYFGAMPEAGAPATGAPLNK